MEMKGNDRKIHRTTESWEQSGVGESWSRAQLEYERIRTPGKEVEGIGTLLLDFISLSIGGTR